MLCILGDRFGIKSIWQFVTISLTQLRRVISFFELDLAAGLCIQDFRLNKAKLCKAQWTMVVITGVMDQGKIAAEKLDRQGIGENTSKEGRSNLRSSIMEAKRPTWGCCWWTALSLSLFLSFFRFCFGFASRDWIPSMLRTKPNSNSQIPCVQGMWKSPWNQSNVSKAWTPKDPDGSANKT